MNPHILTRDCRNIELDMLEVRSLLFEDKPLPDYRPILKSFEKRVSDLADKLEQFEKEYKAFELYAKLWEFTFENSLVTFEFRGLQTLLFMDQRDIDGKLISRRLMAVADSIPAAVKKVLQPK
jgi:hypothetical protein